MKMTKKDNNKIFNKHISLIKKLSLNNWIPAEIAKKIGMDRHCFLNRLRKTNFKINKRSNRGKNGKKICFGCKKEKSIKEFYNRDKYVKNSFSARCKACRKIYVWKNKELFMFYQIKNRARRENIKFNVTIDDIIIPEYCPILKVKLDTNNTQKNYKYSPSVDRINPLRGYVKGNIMVISMKANVMKSDASKEELINFSNYFRKSTR